MVNVEPMINLLSSGLSPQSSAACIPQESPSLIPSVALISKSSCESEGPRPPNFGGTGPFPDQQADLAKSSRRWRCRRGVPKYRGGTPHRAPRRFCLIKEPCIPPPEGPTSVSDLFQGRRPRIAETSTRADDKLPSHVEEGLTSCRYPSGYVCVVGRTGRNGTANRDPIPIGIPTSRSSYTAASSSAYPLRFRGGAVPSRGEVGNRSKIRC